ncbi:MAG: hypothetical protein ACRD68_16675 [Pyrinomonadaceae bacterium]
MSRRFTTFTLAASLLMLSAGFLTPPAAAGQDKTKEPTAEQIAELVVFIYGGRERMVQIQRSGVERGRVTRVKNEGGTEDVTYERRFVRGETSEKDKVRLDQKMPSAEYSLVYNGGRVWGVINGTAFTPRQEAVTDFLTPSYHGLGALLRYKENGATVSFVGKDKQKGIDMWIIDLVDKEKRRTRYYVSSQKWRVLWLEYEETPPGAATPVKFKRTFHDYRYAQGQLFPYRSVLYADGKQAEETNVLNVSFGIKMDDSFFQDSERTANTSAQN